MELATGSQIPKEVADIFNAPSDDEDFVGFREDVPMETLSSEESCDSFDSLESAKQDVRFRSKYFTEELRRIFIEDTDSEDFEGFTQSDLSGSSSAEGKLEGSDLSDCGSEASVGEEEGDDEEEAPPRRGRPRRSGLGLRVALQFPKKTAKAADKSAPEPLFPGSGAQDGTRAALRRNKSCRPGPEREDSASEPEDDSRDEEGQESSDPLLKRTMNIKENKAMLAQLLAELNSVPDLFPVRTPSSASRRRTSRRAFSEGQVPRRTNPARSARPPEKFALEKFTVSATQFAEEFCRLGRRKTVHGGRCRGLRRRRASSFRSVEDITEEDLENVAITVRDKIYDKVLGNTCHQCRQKTIDTKTVCRNQSCGGVRGQFCGPCLRNRYGEDVRSALLDPVGAACEFAGWVCPPCRGICNCSYCRRRDGRCATGILIHLAKFYGYNNVKEYLESLQKQLVEDN